LLVLPTWGQLEVPRKTVGNEKRGRGGQSLQGQQKPTFLDILQRFGSAKKVQVGEEKELWGTAVEILVFEACIIKNGRRHQQFAGQKSPTTQKKERKERKNRKFKVEKEKRSGE